MAKPTQEVSPLTLLQKSIVIGSLLVWTLYLGWRAVNTLNLQAPIYSGLFFGAELIGFLSLARYAFTTFHLRKRESLPIQGRPTVDVLIPTFDENPELIFQTVYHCIKMEYPHETYVLDDGRRPEVEKLALELGAHYIARQDNRHAKAGNLNHALPKTRGDIIAVLDADGVPRRDFLVKLLGYFNDPKVGLVQVPQAFYNFDSFQHVHDGRERQMWNEQSLFFDVIEPGLDHHGAAMCCGSGSLLRRSALEKIGGFTTGTVTEDLHTTFSLHNAGFKSVYHAEPLAFCLAPGSIEAFVVQRARWALGTIQMFCKEWKRILFSKQLSARQKLIYFTPIYYITAAQKAIYLMAPVIYISSGISPFDAPNWFIVPLVANIGLSFWSFKILARGRGRALSTDAFYLYVIWHYLEAIVLGATPLQLPFRVTPKGTGRRASVMLLIPSLIVIAGSALALGMAAHGVLTGESDFGTWVAASFATINLVTGFVAVLMSTRRPVSNEAYSFFDYRPLQIRKINGVDSVGRNLGIATVISLKHLSFLHVHEFKAGDRLEFALDLPDSNIRIEAEVLACSPRITSGHEPCFQVDLGYVSLSDQARLRLIDYFFEDATPRAFNLQAQEPLATPRDKRNTRRNHPRISALLPITIQPQGAEAHLGLLVDLSAGGARLKLPMELKVGTMVQLQVPWFVGTREAKVSRCLREDGQVNPPCDIGLEFLSAMDLSERQRKSIAGIKSSASTLLPAA